MSEIPAKLSKKQEALKWINQQSLACLKCIHCGNPLLLEEDSLVCIQGHRFDLAKQGYLFLAQKAYATKYDQDLFQARRQVIMTSGLYVRLHEVMRQEMMAYVAKQPADQTIQVIDAGSGEGSHLNQLRLLMREANLRYMALDLSKAGVQMATTYNASQLNIVADLSRIPLLDYQTDIVLSILSPSNYEEFKRIMKPKGLLIKVLPNPGYLQEIRQTLTKMGIESRQEEYSNEEVIQTFKKHYPQMRQVRVQDCVNFSRENLACLIKMTPLTWRLSEEQLAELLNRLDTTISLDVTVIMNK